MQFGRVLHHHKGICFGRVGYDRDRLRPGGVNDGERPERWFIFNDIIPRRGKILLALATFSDSGAGSIRVFLLHLLPGFFGGGTGSLGSLAAIFSDRIDIYLFQTRLRIGDLGGIHLTFRDCPDDQRVGSDVGGVSLFTLFTDGDHSRVSRHLDE